MRSGIDQKSINKTIKQHVKKHTEIRSKNSSKMDPRAHPKSTKNRSRGHLGPRNAPKMVQERPWTLILTILVRCLLDFGTILDRFWDTLRRFWNDTKSFRPPIDHSTKEPDQPCTASPNPLFCILWLLPFDFDLKSIT